jgi:dTDP-glucose pyrophosphorylase
MADVSPFEVCRVASDASLGDGMRSLERSHIQIALMVDADGRLIGTLTDGDIRRALLGGATLDSPAVEHVSKTFISAPPDARRADVIDLMQARRINQVPVIDGAGRLVGLHLLHELLGAVERPNWAVIMAGGRGTRLLPLTESLPKPMLRVAGRPILERLVLHLVGCGMRRIFVAVNYLGSVIEDHFGDGARLGCRIEYLREAKPLGTGGALSLLPERPTEPLLALNGDLVVQFDVAALLEFHARHANRITLGVHDYTHTVPFGVVAIADGRVTDLREKPTLVWPTNAGIYVLAPDVIARVPSGVEFPLPALVEDCLQRGERVGAFHIEGDWIDVGRAPELERARGRTTP